MDLSLRIGGSLLWVADGVCFPQIHAPGRDRQPAERRLAGPSRGLGGLYDDRAQGGDMEPLRSGAGHGGLDIAGLYTTVDCGVVCSLVQAGFSLLFGALRLSTTCCKRLLPAARRSARSAF